MQHGDQPVAGDDRPVVDEALLAVHDPAEVDAGLGVARCSWASQRWATMTAKVGGAMTSG